VKSVFFLPVTFFCFFLSGSSWPGLAAPEDAAPEDADVLANAFSAGLRLSMIPWAKDGASVGTESSATYSSILIKKEEAYLIAPLRFLLSKVDLPSLIEFVFLEFKEN